MNGKLMLYLDQYGTQYYAHNLRELQMIVGGGRIGKIYNTVKGVDYHIGYHVGTLWLHAYILYKEVV